MLTSFINRPFCKRERPAELSPPAKKSFNRGSLQTVEVRPHLSVFSPVSAKGRSGPWRPPPEYNPVGGSLVAQKKTLLQKGFDQLKKSPENSRETAHTLQKMFPNEVRGYHLEARALAELGRPQECLAVLDRPPCNRKHEPCLRITRGRALQELGRLEEAETEFRILYEHYSDTAEHKKTNGLALGRVLQDIGDRRAPQVLVIFTQLREQLAGKPDTPCDDPDIELALARHLQKMGGTAHLHSALDILTCLCKKKAGNRLAPPCDDSHIEMALARVYEDLGRLQESLAILTDLHQRLPNDRKINLSLAIAWHQEGSPESRKKALATLTALRKQSAGNRADTPCNDKKIELALGRVLQAMGGAHNTEQALTIFTRLRQQQARGQPDTPCGDKAIEQTLSRYWQSQGGRENQHKALTILTDLRQRAAGNRAATACHDRDIELALGTLLSKMEGPENLRKALAIFTHLRTLSGSKDEQTPCDNQEIELPVATCLTELHEWQAFDKWNSERPRFEDRYEIELIQSIRYFAEFLSRDSRQNSRLDLLEKAFRHAESAVDKSDCLDPASLSQLAHCYRILGHWPSATRKRVCGLYSSKEQINSCVRNYFAQARRLDPNRRERSHDELWRQRERDWLKRVEQPCKKASRSHERCQPPTAPQSEQGVAL